MKNDSGTTSVRQDEKFPCAPVRDFYPQLLICIALVILTLIVYWPVCHYGFVNYDDLGYVADNQMVHRGITAETVRWAFRTATMSNWHPLTWISYLLDWDIYGNHPGAFHFTNLLFHVANVILLFLLVERMTHACWESFVVAAIFAVHPLHMESVAWISERKDVLSGFFFLLTLLAYVSYVRKDEEEQKDITKKTTPFLLFSFSPRRRFFFFALIFFALGLMSKPMLVTLPCVLLLLDFWPLNRVFRDPDAVVFSKETGATFLRLVIEKLPFFVLALLASIATFVAQSKGGSVSSLQLIPVGWRISNAFIACVLYIEKMLWPVKLAIFYPYHTPKILPALAAAMLVLSISAIALATLRRKPIFAVGWFWFLGMLIPVLGIVQVGAQSLADRYTYLPMIGISFPVIWGISELSRRWNFREKILAALSAFVIGTCVVLSRTQLPAWRNSETLWRHAIAVTSRNDLANHNLGAELMAQGRYDEAMRHFEKAIEIYPPYAEAHDALGTLLTGQGKFDEALEQYQLAIKYKPNVALFHLNLGDLFKASRPQEAILEYLKALELQPDLWRARFNLANVLSALHRADAAIAEYKKLVRHKPDLWQAHVNLGLLEMGQENNPEAKRHFATALELNPNYAQAHFLLGSLLAKDGETNAAITEYRAALKLNPHYSEAERKLAALTNKSD